jgi:L-fucose isomerase-like protein
LLDQVFIDGAQRRHPGAGAKLMQHPDIGGALPMRQPRKASPSTLLRQQADHGVKTVCRGQQRQQMNPPKLGGAEKWARPRLRARGQERVDKLIRNKCRKHFQ